MKGLEIGGPSNYFKKYNSLPIYPVINSLDGVNFATSTVWEGDIANGLNYRFGHGKTGYQYISDAVNLKDIPSQKYDFVLSCNSLEHISNPFKAIKEWIRVIKSNGIIMLILPRKESNTDHNRQITTFDHLKSDYEYDTKEDDMTHLEDILQLHDISMDFGVRSFEEFNMRSLKNYENRCLHQHVFDLIVLKEVFNYFKASVILTSSLKSNYIIAGRVQ